MHVCLYVCMHACTFLNVFDENNSSADQRYVGYDFLSVVIQNTSTISLEIDLPSFSIIP